MRRSKTLKLRLLSNAIDSPTANFQANSTILFRRFFRPSPATHLMENHSATKRLRKATWFTASATTVKTIMVLKETAKASATYRAQISPLPSNDETIDLAY